MSATSLEVKAGTSKPVTDAAEARRKRRRQPEDQGAVPMHIYGMKRGTVTLLTVLCALFSVFTLVPIAWILINSTKSQRNLLYSFGFWFARPFEFFHTFGMLFQNVDGQGIYFRWFLNTLIRSTVMKPGTMTGNATRKKIFSSPAPSTRAASISSRGT